MKHFILLIPALFFLSCGTFKKATTKTKESETVNLQVESVTTRTITETTNTLVEVPGCELEADGSLEQLIAGGFIEAENKDLSVKVSLDSTTRKLRATVRQKPQKIAISSQRNIVEVVKENEKKETRKLSKTRAVDKKAETGINWLWILLVMGLLFLFILLFKRYFWK